MRHETRVASGEQFTDSVVQRAISAQLSNYCEIDLSIPAQRQVADRVRAEVFGLPPLLGTRTVQVQDWRSE